MIIPVNDAERRSEVAADVRRGVRSRIDGKRKSARAHLHDVRERAGVDDKDEAELRRRVADGGFKTRAVPVEKH